jgi:hypothetical protein
LNNEKVLLITKFSVVIYLLIFQAWKVFQDYPAGVLQEEFKPVGIFHILPGPLDAGILDFVCYLWPVFLVLALFPRMARIGLFGSFFLGCYVLGYAYNFGRIFHGTSLVLQMLLVLAIGTPSRKQSAAQREAMAAVTIGVAQLIICLAYFSSGVAKLIKSGTEWALSENLAVILHTQALSTPLQDWLLGAPAILLQFLALGVLLVEVTSLLPWFLRRLSGVYIAAWVLFHVGVGLTLGGHSTFFSHLFLYPVFLGSMCFGVSGFQGLCNSLFPRESSTIS